MAGFKYKKACDTYGYAKLDKNCFGTEPDKVIEGHINEYAYGKKGKTFACFHGRSERLLSFWLGEEADPCLNDR